MSNNIEHPPTGKEFELMERVDFVVPLKQVGLITRAVLEAIHLFYNPRRIVVITAQDEATILTQLVKRWACGKVVCLAEETFFEPNFNLTLEKIRSYYDFNRPGDRREPGWWIQQLIKLGAGTQIKDISETYIVWDGDLVPTRRWKLCDVDSNGDTRWYIAILQSESRSEFNTTQYAKCMEALTGFTPLDPYNGGGTFVAHHMVFQKKYVTELLELMIETTKSTLPWPLLIMSQSRVYYRFSEYKTYCTFMTRFHPLEFNYHPLDNFGEGGLRFREANEVIEDLLATCPFSNGGLSYSQIKDYFFAKWSGGIKPAYVQLDHVYGLDGVDLNLSGPIPASREKFSLKVFSQLKELKSAEDIPADLLYAPVNVCIVKESGVVNDDSAIRRMTIGTAMKTPFNHLNNNRTTPRRPNLQKYYLGASIPSSSISLENQPHQTGQNQITSHVRANMQSLFTPPAASTIQASAVEPLVPDIKSPWIRAV